MMISEIDDDTTPMSISDSSSLHDLPSSRRFSDPIAAYTSCRHTSPSLRRRRFSDSAVYIRRLTPLLSFARNRRRRTPSPRATSPNNSLPQSASSIPQAHYSAASFNDFGNTSLPHHSFTNISPNASLPLPQTTYYSTYYPSIPVNPQFHPFTPSIPFYAPPPGGTPSIPFYTPPPGLTTLPPFTPPVTTAPGSNMTTTQVNGDKLELLVSLLIEKLQGTQISITLGANQQQPPPPPPPLRTLRDLLAAILDYCFENPTISIPLILSFLGYQSYSWSGTGYGSAARNSTG